LTWFFFRKNQENYEAAGGFDVADDEIEERRAKLAELAQQSLFNFAFINIILRLERDREAQTSEQPDTCVDCNKFLFRSQLWETYNHPVCDIC
jgi:hypothetical protein